MAIRRREFMMMTAAAAATCALPTRVFAQQTVTGVGSLRPIFRWLPVRSSGMTTGIQAWVTPPELSGGNVLMVKADGKLAVVDGKSPWAASGLVHDGEHYLTADMNEQTSVFINTHHHFDHTGGNAVFNGRARRFCHERAAPRIRGQVQRVRTAQASAVEQAQAAINGANPSEPILSNPSTGGALITQAGLAASQSSTVGEGAILPDRQFGDGVFTLDGTATPIKMISNGPGHTDNDAAVWFEKLNILHAGDLVFHELHPFFDDTAGVSLTGWIQRLRELRDVIDTRTIVVPGHGSVTDHRGLTKQLSYLTQLRDNVTREIERGTPRDRVVQMEWEFMRGYGFGQFRERAIGVAYDQISSG